MRITESKLRRIIRSLIKENWESEQSLKEDLRDLSQAIRDCGYDGEFSYVYGETATERNMAYAWSKVPPNDKEKIYNQIEKYYKHLLSTLKRVMNSSDMVKTKTYKS